MTTVVDWKSDVDPAPATVQRYAGQMLAYLRATDAEWGGWSCMTAGWCAEVLNEQLAQ